MPRTLVIQSHRSPLPFRWLQACIDSVVDWSRSNGFDYRFLGDEIFELVDATLLKKVAEQLVVASDLARLHALQRGLDEGYEAVVWCDADFLILRPEEFVLPAGEFALGREVWIQHDDSGRLRTYTKVHNAFMMFRRGNSFLRFYLDTAERLIALNDGRRSPQFIGPKLLTALHNIAHFPVMEAAAMLSPLVMRDICSGGGAALDLFRSKSPAVPAGANLSSSLTAAADLSESDMADVIGRLLTDGI